MSSGQLNEWLAFYQLEAEDQREQELAARATANLEGLKARRRG